MRNKRKGWIFEFPLIAKDDAASPNGIKISPDPHGPNAHHWNAATKTLTFNKDNFNGMKKVDHFYIEFTLDDRSTQNLRFPCNPEDAMWVKNGPACPTVTACQYDTVKPLAVVGDDVLLAVNFDDVRGRQLGFALNFVKDGDDDTDPANYIPWDPIINNRNGGS